MLILRPIDHFDKLKALRLSKGRLRAMDFGELGSAELTVEASRVVRHPKHEAQTRRELKGKAP